MKTSKQTPAMIAKSLTSSRAFLLEEIAYASQLAILADYRSPYQALSDLGLIERVHDPGSPSYTPDNPTEGFWITTMLGLAVDLARVLEDPHTTRADVEVCELRIEVRQIRLILPSKRKPPRRPALHIIHEPVK